MQVEHCLQCQLFEHVGMDPKGGELFLRELTSEETLIEDLCDTDVQIVHFTRE